MSKTDMIQKRLQVLDELKDELKELRNHRKDILEDDPALAEMQEKADLVKEQTKEKKKQVLEAPEYKVIEDQMKEIREEIRDQKEALSQELIELYKEEGVTQIEDPEGNLKRLKFSVRLINA